MTTKQEETTQPTNLPTDLKAEQALGLIGMGLMQKMMREGPTSWEWPETEDNKKTDLHALRQRLESTSLAIETGAPLSTAEVTQLLGARPGSTKTERGGLIATRISRNIWKLSRAAKDDSYWRN